MGKDLKGKELGTGIMQRADGRYCGRFTDRFGQRQTVYSTKLKDLKFLVNNAICQNGNRTNILNERITLNDWYASWIDIYKKNTVRETTLNDYIGNYERYVRSNIGCMRLKDINAVHIQKLLNELHDKGLSYKTITKVRVILVDIFEKAILSDYMIKNPAQRTKAISKKQKERRVLTLDEQRIFLNNAKVSWYEPMFCLA